MTISQRQVRSRRLPGKPGQLYDLTNEQIDFTNAYPQAVQVSTITVGGTPAEDDEYEVVVNGVDVLVSASDGDDKAAVAEALAQAINNDPAIRATVEAEAAGDVVTLTGLIPGIPFTLESDTGDLTVATSDSPEEADPIPFGRVCFRGGASDVAPYPNRLGRLPEAGDSGSQDKLALGISLFTYETEGVGYGPNERVAAIKRGRVWVEVSESVGELDDVYVGTSPGEEGKLFTGSGAGRLQLDRSIIRWSKDRSEDGLAVVECDFT